MKSRMASRVHENRKVNNLLSQLQEALVAKEQARIEATVAQQMARQVARIGKGAAVVAAPGAAAPETAAASIARKRRAWSAAAKANARERMKKFWPAKRAKK